jgi:hypothetical protein
MPRPVSAWTATAMFATTTTVTVTATLPLLLLLLLGNTYFIAPRIPPALVRNLEKFDLEKFRWTEISENMVCT